MKNDQETDQPIPLCGLYWNANSKKLKEKKKKKKIVR